MISKLHIRNFRSIVDYTLDLSYAEGKAPAYYKTMPSYPFLQPKGNANQRLVPCLALFGANASGKSNLLRAFYALTDLVTKRNAVVVHNPNRLHPSLETTLFSIDFNLGTNKYVYRIEYKDTGILSESLSVNEKELFHIQNMKGSFSGMKTKVYSEAKLREILRVECSEGKPKYDESRLIVKENTQEAAKQRSTFLSVIGNNYAGLNADVTRAYRFFEQDLLFVPAEMRNELLWMNIENLAAVKGYENLDSALEDISNLLTKFDIGIKRLSFQTDMYGS